MNDEKFQAQGHCELLELSITNKLGRTISLFSMHGEVIIQEDIFSPVCSGSVTIIDSANLHEDLPIVGEESITLTYRDGENLDYVTRTFSVFALVDKIKLTDKNYGYTLVFVSPEFMKNINTKISRAFTNISASDIVKSILTNDVLTKKAITIEPTAMAVSYIAPNISPFAVSYAMVPRSYSTTNQLGSSYMFFENARGFNFLPIETLIQKEPVSFVLANSNYDYKIKSRAILKYSYVTAVDTVSNSLGGGLSSKVVVIDDDNRQLNNVSYDNNNEEHYKRTQHVNGNSPSLRLNKGVTPINPDEIGAASQTYVLSSNQDKDNSRATRRAKLSSFVNGPKVNIEVPFISSLTVGDTVQIDIPTQISGDGMNDIMPDLYLGGKYLVTACRHIISSDTGVSCLELARDTYSSSHEDSIDATNKRLGIKQ